MQADAVYWKAVCVGCPLCRDFGKGERADGYGLQLHDRVDVVVVLINVAIFCTAMA